MMHELVLRGLMGITECKGEGPPSSPRSWRSKSVGLRVGEGAVGGGGGGVVSKREKEPEHRQTPASWCRHFGPLVDVIRPHPLAGLGTGPLCLSDTAQVFLCTGGPLCEQKVGTRRATEREEASPPPCCVLVLSFLLLSPASNHTSTSRHLCFSCHPPDSPWLT